MCAKVHTIWFRRHDGSVFSAEALTFSKDGVSDIKDAFKDNSHFIGVTSDDQTSEQNEAVLRKVGSPIPL